ncbi:MAG: hypothetical protein US62_C0015G0008 [Candidatus Woesebacteria bacterium GW2011_GWA1_37_8]|uniref:Uncharacterized protein n=2 Tax=Candidatus Woeseibacteriota TaxID=1752722 RepID=A0A0G0LI86_9BACT|nr:MAG: hypothetical protein US39_C0005G0017 [Microgenomates group bacterium GW2011_GWC1_37_12b]KKQ45427.1 MAG: hypothetical protein US62_C0015G0008 [Candidatus Woesebacteria bacterium GW2011_GWA1_37_8]KKQ87630.1 MAG: hypothetical protein UT10_C0003G0034 [Candidatus Woesebacteria bacterium GW2011_GWB1_38_8b]
MRPVEKGPVGSPSDERPKPEDKPGPKSILSRRFTTLRSK